MVFQRLTADLLFKPVTDVGGKRLGHVFEVRCAVGDQIVIVELMYGTRGLLASMGLREPQIKCVSWQQVREVREHEIVLR